MKTIQISFELMLKTDSCLSTVNLQTIIWFYYCFKTFIKLFGVIPLPKLSSISQLTHTYKRE